MKTEYITNRWLRMLDIVGMVIAPISFTLPFFLVAIQRYQTATFTGTNYNDVIFLILLALGILLLLGFGFRRPFKSYVNHQETRDDVILVRILYSGFILGSLIIIFLFFLSIS